MSHTCIAKAALTACADQNIATGETCSGVGFDGICQGAQCLPGCGDGVIGQSVEECDDGNFKSHDGCSSGCKVETPSWAALPDPWTGMLSHVAGYHASSNRLILLTGVGEKGLRTERYVVGVISDVGSNWQPLDTTTTPTPRFGAAMAYDADRHKLVLFGGSNTAELADTWEYDVDAVNGFFWTQVTPVGSPPARFGASMVYDTVSKKIVLFGGQTTNGYLGDTWEYNGTSWVDRTNPTHPTARSQMGMAYDDTSARTVLFGGRSGDTIYGDLWQYNGGTWTLLASTSPPLARTATMMAYSPARGGVVMFGGLANLGSSTAPQLVDVSDTWLYNGSWNALASTRVPPSRNSGTLTTAWDGEPILLGGTQSDGRPPLADVWRLRDDGEWVEFPASGLPAARYGAPAVYDRDAQELHVLGGRGSIVRPDAVTWADRGWPEFPELTHPVLYLHTMAYDEVRKHLVVFGGIDKNQNVSNTTWEHEKDFGYTWTSSVAPGSPSPRRSGVMAFDGDRLVLFGGRLAGSTSNLDETWEYDGTWSKASSTGPAASEQAAAAYDPVHHRLVLFDAAGGTWMHTNHTWTRIVQPDELAPPRRDLAAMTFDWQTRRIVLAGGVDGTEYLTDVWELDDKTWHKVDVPPGGPLPRVMFGFASDERHRDTVLVTGASAGLVSHGDVWSYKYRSDTPEEDCYNVEVDAAGVEVLDQDGNTIPIDDDGDLHANNRDPDCCGTDGPPTCLER